MKLPTYPLYQFEASGYRLKANLSDTNSALKRFANLWSELGLIEQGTLSITGIYTGAYSHQLHMRKKTVEGNLDLVSGQSYKLLEDTANITFDVNEETKRFVIKFDIQTQDGFFEKFSLDKLESTIETFLFNKDRAMLIDKVSIALNVPAVNKQYQFV